MRRTLLAFAFVGAAVGLPMAAVRAANDAAQEAPPADLQALNIREAALAARIGVNRSRLAHLLGALQRFSRDPPPPLLTPPEEARDSVRAAILIRAMTPELQRRAQALAAQSAELTRLRREAAAADGERFVSESEAADLQRVDGLFASAQNAQAAALPAPTHIAPPIGSRITSPYGGRLTSGAPSRGLEYGEAPGEAVLSPAAGVVDYAGPLEGWGQVLILRCGGGYHIVLAGLSAIIVQPGQSVASGQAVGTLPDRVNPPARLYMEVRLGAEPIDPAPLLADRHQ